MTTVYESNRFAFQVSGLDIGRECRGAGDLSDLQRAGYGCRRPCRGYDAKGNPLSGFGTGTGIWLLVSTLASLSQARSSPAAPHLNRGGLHGLLSWAITTLLTTRLVVSLASGVVGLAGSAVGKGLSLAGSTWRRQRQTWAKASSNSWIKGHQPDWGSSKPVERHAQADRQAGTGSGSVGTEGR